VTSPSAKRRQGAQPGNRNALKHGFYASAFRAGELTDLDAILTEGVQDEITMLRVATRRVIEFIDEFTTPMEATATLGALGLAATRLATLLKTQKILEGSDQNTAAALSQALAEVIKELGIDGTSR
jgi:hypothetical protein